MTQTFHISIEGMHCGGCEKKIRTALEQLEQATEVSADAQSGSAILNTEGDIEEQRIRDAVSDAGDYRVTSIDPLSDEEQPQQQHAHTHDESGDDERLYPLFLIVGFILGVTVLIAWSSGRWEAMTMMRHFMAGFFIVFSFFKLLDPPGFVSAYRGYDLIAKGVPAWGWVYPFVELGLGVMYLMAWAMIATNVITLVLMLIGAAGVLRALLDKKAIRCACLGTALNLPMTKVTLVEDLTMAVMAGVMLIFIG